MDGVGVLLFLGLFFVDELFRKYGVCDEVKLFVLGKLLMVDKVVVVLLLGVDCVNIVRGFMFFVGCI